MSTTQNHLDPTTVAKLQGLRLRARRIVEGYVSGLHRSPYHGFSIEFAQHRDYAPGDDLRYIDWKVFGRTDKFYLKQYEDETNLVGYLLVDTSQSMTYRGPKAAMSKLDYARCLAASLAWLVLHQQDSLALATFDRQVRHLIRPAGSAAQLQAVLQALEAEPSPDRSVLGAVFHELARRLTKRGVVIVISDLLDEPEAMLAGLSRFGHQRHDVLVLHVLDPAELDFPFDRPTLFHGLEGWPELQTDPRLLRAAYLKELRQYRQQIEQGCRARGFQYRLISTDQPFDLVLSDCLNKRRTLT